MGPFSECIILTANNDWKRPTERHSSARQVISSVIDMKVRAHWEA